MICARRTHTNAGVHRLSTAGGVRADLLACRFPDCRDGDHARHRVAGLTWLISGKVNRILLFSALLVLAFGGIGLALQNDTVFKWKPTVFSWIIAIALAISQYVGDRPLVQRLLDAAARGDLQLAADWRTLNWMWAAFFAITGAANILVAYRFSETFWVNFKVFGLTGMTIAFSLLQGLWIFRRDAAHSKSE
jgi:intracellular septation protein